MSDANSESVDLSAYEEKYLFYRATKYQFEVLKKRLDNYKKEFQEYMGDAKVATIAGEVVFTYDHTDTFRWNQFEEENPVLAKQYTKPVLKDVPDLEALKRDHPALYERYRSRQFVTKKVT